LNEANFEHRLAMVKSEHNIGATHGVHILFLSDNFPPETNAPASRLYEHATKWVKAGHSVTVITCAPNFPTGKVFSGYRNQLRSVEQIDGIRVVRVKTYITANEGALRRTLDYLSFMVVGFLAGLFERHVDVVVATSPQFFCALGGCLLAMAKRKPFLFEVRDMWPDSIVAVGAMKEGPAIRALRRLETFLYRRATAIVVVTSSFKQEMISRGIDGAKIHIVYNGADLSWCRPRPRDIELRAEYALSEKFTIGYFGTLGLAHALHKVLEAAALLRHRTDIVFLFVGAGAERESLQVHAQELGLDNVRFAKPRPKSEMSRLWSICDLTLIPLRDHAVFATVIPSKLFEAMAHEVPVLMALPCGEATSIVKDTGCGLTISPEKPDEMARAVEQLADNRAQLAGMRRSAGRATPRFSREVQALIMLDVLENARKHAR
jgi:colanic acid biosynthesis glycosyl transferase WcaI